MDGYLRSSDEAGDLFFVMENRLQFMGKVPIDTRPSTFRLTGLIASGKLFRQSSLQPPADFGFDFFTETLIPLSEDRVIFTHLDSLYDYRIGHRDPRHLSTLRTRIQTLFYLAGKLFVLNNKGQFYRLDSSYHPIVVDVVPSPSLCPPSGREKLFWDNCMHNPASLSAARTGLAAWTMPDGRLTARMICSAIPTEALLSFAKYDAANEILFLGTNSKGILVIRKNQVRAVQRSSSSFR